MGQIRRRSPLTTLMRNQMTKTKNQRTNPKQKKLRTPTTRMTKNRSQIRMVKRSLQVIERKPPRHLRVEHLQRSGTTRGRNHDPVRARTPRGRSQDVDKEIETRLG